MASGGARPGAGRKKGSRAARIVKAGEIVKRELESGKLTPLEVMLDNMRFAVTKADLLMVVAKTEGAGIEDYTKLLKLRSFAQECAQGAAPYVHPRLSAVANLVALEEPLPRNDDEGTTALEKLKSRIDRISQVVNAAGTAVH